MAIAQGDGSIVLTTKVDTSGMKKSTNELRSEAMKLAAQYRKAGMSQSEAQKKAYQELGITTKETEKATKKTKEYGEQAKKSGAMAKSAFAAVGKAAAAIAVASAAAVVAVTKQSVDAFAEYEQLVGGVETLFKGSSQKLIEYANQAYKTAGLSANQYMATVTSFSASLISSLGGDTEKAADYANRAIIDMSDNANKMGTSMEAIQNAYQGFAKQNYTMLDNLKLGYGGTKTEMERLIKDASQLTEIQKELGVTVDANDTSFGNIVNAISVMQAKMGIAGATFEEAEKTISGSAATMKAAWQNVLTAISGGGDLDRAINNLVESISNYFENIVPVVERALSGIGRLIEKVVPMLVQTVAKSLIKAIPSLLNAVYEMIIGLAKGIYQGIIDLFNGTSKEALTEQAENIEQSVKNQNDLTKAVEETNEAMEKTTASFDTVEILSAGTAQNANAGPIIPEMSGGGLGESLEIEETEKELSAFEKALKKSFNKISKTIKKAWDSSPIKSFWENVILESFWGEFSWQAIGERIKSTTWYMWNSEPVQAFWGAVRSAGQFGLNAFQNIGTSLWENLKTTWGNIEGDFNTMTSNMSGLWTAFWQDVQVGIDTWGQPIIEGVNGVFNSMWTTAIDPYIQLMVGAWSDFTGILKSKWEEYGWPLIDNIGQFAANVIALFQSIYDNVLEPIITPFLQELSSLWNNHISGLVDRFVEFVMKIVNGAVEIYNKFIHPIANWLMKVLAPAWNYIGKLISGVFGTIIGTIADVAGGLFKYLGGIIDFIVGVFTGDWKRAWEGVKSIFKGIFEALVGIVKSPINLIIDFINAFIAGLNKVQFDLPDWGVLGDWAGKKFGLNIPNIPKLAQGTVVPPNKEFMAVLGDNKKEHEIVSPVSTMKQAFMEAMIEMGGNFGGGNTEVVLEIDGREFGRAVVEQGNKENRRIGTRLVIA